MKNYFNKLLKRYFSYYIRPSDTFIDVNPSDDILFNSIKASDREILRSNSVETDGISCCRIKKPDYFILNGTIHYERDIQSFLKKLHNNADAESRILLLYYSSLWKPLIKLATFLKIRRKTPEKNWLTHEDIENILFLADFQLISRRSHCLIPVWIPLISEFINKYIAPLPFFNIFKLFHITAARPLKKNRYCEPPSVSIIIPVRNEESNISEIITRIPAFGKKREIIFIEGNSTDSSWEKLQEISKRGNLQAEIIIDRQDGKGKGDAVRKGFSIAKNDILMILDADMTVPPEELTKFYRAIVSDKGELINGSRLVYPMDKKAMRFINMAGNKFFAFAFSSILGQKHRDTLCGTKVLSKFDYEKIAQNRSFFGRFDPFGDFDLLFGASRRGLKITELPISYKERKHGKTNIARWKHGFILFRMLVFAVKRIIFY